METVNDAPRLKPLNDFALKRAYDAYDKAESDWVTSMNTAERRGRTEDRRAEILDLLQRG